MHNFVKTIVYYKSLQVFIVLHFMTCNSLQNPIMLRFKIYTFPDMFRQKSCHLQGIHTKTIHILLDIRQLCLDLLSAVVNKLVLYSFSKCRLFLLCSHLICGSGSEVLVPFYGISVEWLFRYGAC